MNSIYLRLHTFFGPQYWWPAEDTFEVMVGAILTQNTSWSNVEKAIRNLKDKRALSPTRLFKMPVEELAKLIRPAGYYNIKAR
ncbi:MAG: endonuclease III domain-containing protein, partial [bacterium]